MDRRGLTRIALARLAGVSRMVVWRARLGQPVRAESARKLCAAMPELDYERLTLGQESRP